MHALQALENAAPWQASSTHAALHAPLHMQPNSALNRSADPEQIGSSGGVTASSAAQLAHAVPPPAPVVDDDTAAKDDEPPEPTLALPVPAPPTPAHRDSSDVARSVTE